MPLAAVYPEKMEPGKRYCPVCSPEVFPEFPRNGPNHVAVRFGDHRDADVFLGGSKLLTVYEAYQGDDTHPGWIIRGIRGERGFVICQEGHYEIETVRELVFTNVEIKRNEPIRRPS